MRKILVLRGGALGDFIVTLPALALLRERWPTARIELAGNATAARLALHRGLLDAVHSQHEARWGALFARDPLASDFRAWLQEFDLIVSYWPDPDADLARRFPLRAEQQFIAAAALPTQAPAAAHYAAPLRQLGLEARTFHYRLEPRLEEDPELPPLAVHPGSGSPRKNWPAARWRELIPTLSDRVAVILGEGELSAPDASAWLTPHSPWVLLLRMELENLVAYFARCRLFVGHDSGISHLAAACGVPCVLLFGPTDPAVWAPPAPHVRVLRQGEDLRSIAPEDVRRAAAEVLAGQT